MSDMLPNCVPLHVYKPDQPSSKWEEAGTCPSCGSPDYWYYDRAEEDGLFTRLYSCDDCGHKEEE